MPEEERKHSTESVFTPSTINKLIAAFNNGFNISEACHYAEIGRDTYYKKIQRDPEFKEKMAKAQSAVGRKAKEVIVHSIQEGNTGDAWRWLERRDPDFKPKQEIENADLQEKRDRLKEFLDELGKDDEPEETEIATEIAGDVS